MISGYCCHLLHQWSKLSVIHNVGDERKLLQFMKMVNKFIIEEAKLFENKREPFAFKVGVSLFRFLLCQFCAHCSHLPSISMFVHDLSFQALVDLSNASTFNYYYVYWLWLLKVLPKASVFLVFYLLVMIVESFIKTSCIQGHWNFQCAHCLVC